MKKRALCIVGIMIFLTGCSAVKVQNSGQSLYQRLGSNKGIYAVVNSFINRVGADGRINVFFQGVDLNNLKALLTEQLCQLAGGPCIYSGRDMKTAHQGLAITGEAFDAMVENLTGTFNELAVGQAEQQEIVSALGLMRADIVEK